MSRLNEKQIAYYKMMDVWIMFFFKLFFFLTSLNIANIIGEFNDTNLSTVIHIGGIVCIIR